MPSTLSNRGRAPLALAGALMITQIDDAVAHGFAGERFFPATILTDDPFVADEISLPQVTVNPPHPMVRGRPVAESIFRNASRQMSALRSAINGNAWNSRACRRLAVSTRCRPVHSTSSSSTDRTRRWACSGST
jgi:hypothetical protein